MISSRLVSSLASILLGGCVGETSPGQREQRLDAVDDVVVDTPQDEFLWYEVFVPHDRLREVTDPEHGLWPSSAPHAESAEGAYYIELMNQQVLEDFRGLGFEPVLAPIEALTPDAVDALGDGPMGPQGGPDCTHRQPDFCQYDGAGPCVLSIRTELLQISQNAATSPFTTLVQSQTLTYEGRPVVGLRIGVENGTNDPPVSQLLVFGGQHAKEWAGVGAAMAFIRRLVADYQVGGEVRDWLDETPVLVVPVANPDGYVYSYTTPARRLWRANRAPFGASKGPCPCGGSDTCTNPPGPPPLGCYCAGADPNRNFPFNWRARGGCNGSDVTSYPGPSAGSERETAALNELFLHYSVPLTGSYVTRFVMNMHAWGDYVLYPDGITAGADGDLHYPCRRDDDPDEQILNELPQNCQPPEYDVYTWIGGTTPEPQLVDEFATTTMPYRNGTIYRALYETVGDELSHHSASSTLIDHASDPWSLDRRALGVSTELTSSPEGFRVECWGPAAFEPGARWDDLIDEHYAFLLRVLENLPTLANRTNVLATLGNRRGFRIHRLKGDDDIESAFYGPPRLWADVPSGPEVWAFNGGENWGGETHDFGTASLFYKTIFLEREGGDPYQFDDDYTICQGPTCEEFGVEGNPPINLCSGTRYSQGGSGGWTFVGQGASDDCYFKLTSAGGTAVAPYVLQRTGNMSRFDRIRLNFSYRLNHTNFSASNGYLRVVISANGAPTITQVYPASRVGHSWTIDDNRIRTETIELPSQYNQRNAILVKFEAFGLPVGWTGETLNLYDMILVGRVVP